MSKTIEKVQLSEQDYDDYAELCKTINRSLRGQTAILIRHFLTQVKSGKIKITEQ